MSWRNCVMKEITVSTNSTRTERAIQRFLMKAHIKYTFSASLNGEPATYIYTFVASDDNAKKIIPLIDSLRERGSVRWFNICDIETEDK